MDQDGGPAERRRGAVAYSRALGRRICSRVAAGESQLAICAEPGMPARSTLWRWVQDKPPFAAEFQAARVAGGVARTNGRLSSFCQATADEICRRIAEGESMIGICRDPAMPCFSTVYYWRRQYAGFAEALRVARETQAEWYCDVGWEIASAVTPATAYATHVRLAQLRWTAAVRAPRVFGRTRPVEPAGPAPEQIVLLKTFKAEPGPDGQLRVVSYVPNPETGRVEKVVGD